MIHGFNRKSLSTDDKKEKIKWDKKKNIFIFKKAENSLYNRFVCFHVYIACAIIQ